MIKTDALDEMVDVVEENHAMHKVKEYSINKSDIDTFYFLGKKLYENNIKTDRKMKYVAGNITAASGIYVPKEILETSLKFYEYCKAGMMRPYSIKWDDYEFILNESKFTINDIKDINEDIKKIIYKIC